jgi:hypothetical protein
MFSLENITTLSSGNNQHAFDHGTTHIRSHNIAQSPDGNTSAHFS